MGGVWFVSVFLVIATVWTLDPHATPTPDEAVNRQAAGLVRKHATPFIQLPFADPEDLAHPRSWVTVGDHAVPSYAPLAIYWYGLLLRFGKLGLALSVALPASAAAAFAVGTAKLLPESRRWLAFPAPLLGSPALYWLMRPWMNLSLMLSCLCWAFFSWASWRHSGRAKYLSFAAIGVGAAAAVRPDYAAYLFTAALLFGLAEGAAPKRVVLLILAAGASAVVVNLALNALTTGHPLLAAYQIEVGRAEGLETRNSTSLLQLLVQLLAPMGVPTFANAAEFLAKYWLSMGFIAGLALAQLALVPLLVRQPGAKRALCALALLVMFCFMLSRMDPMLHGASEPESMLHHSIPRYWAPIYLIAAVPPIVFLARHANRIVLTLGAVFLFAIALGNAYDVGFGTQWSLVDLRRYERRSTELARSLSSMIPRDAFVYTETYDKILWRRWRLGTLAEPRATAESMARASRAGLAVYAFEPPMKTREHRALDRALRRRGLTLRPLNTRGLSRVVAPSKKRQRRLE